MALIDRRLRLLFLLPFAPRLGGLHGGARATGQLIAGLALRHEVAVLFLAQPGEGVVEDELEKRCDRLEGVEPARAPGRLRPKLALLRGVPTWASELADAGFAARVGEAARSWRPDLVQLEFPVMGQYLTALEEVQAPRVLVDHDASVRDLRTWHGSFAPLTRALDERAWRGFERRVLNQVQAAVVFTEADRMALERLGTSTQVVRIPLGSSISASPLDPAGREPLGVVFVGNFAHPPNSDAALWLASEIFPAVRALRPGARLTLVGRSPPPEIQALEGEGVVVTGEVADVTPYLEDAAVVAAPIRTGGGMRVKVLEALAAGKATVATPLAAAGLDVTSGEQLEIAETAESFRDALAGLLDDEPRRRGLGQSARCWATEHLGWEASVAAYEELYASLTPSART